MLQTSIVEPLHCTQTKGPERPLREDLGSSVPLGFSSREDDAVAKKGVVLSLLFVLVMSWGLSPPLCYQQTGAEDVCTHTAWGRQASKCRGGPGSVEMCCEGDRKRRRTGKVLRQKRNMCCVAASRRVWKHHEFRRRLLRMRRVSRLQADPDAACLLDRTGGWTGRRLSFSPADRSVNEHRPEPVGGKAPKRSSTMIHYVVSTVRTSIRRK